LLTGLLGVACGRTPAPSGSARGSSSPVPSSDPTVAIPPPTAAPAPSPYPRTPAVDDKGIEAWILSRLRAPGRELLPLDHGVALEVRERHEVEAARDLRVEGPALWLHVFRFAGHARAKAAEKPLTEALGAKHPELNYPQSTVTGAYLLVVGFPSEKPASPEMRAAQTAYLSAFAGEE
jgi:hypothetical protein